MSEYAGETDTKAVARAMAYEMVAKALPPARLGHATVCALAGDDAHDLGPIVAFGLTHDPRDVLLVDRHEEGLEVARRRWPGVRTFRGDLSEVIAPWPIDVLVADFCGLALSTDNAAGLFRAAQQVNRGGGVIAVTYLRGRESVKGSPELAAWLHGRTEKELLMHGLVYSLLHGGSCWNIAGNKHLGERTDDPKDCARFIALHDFLSVVMTGERVLGRLCARRRGWTYVDPVGHMEYFDNSSPMGIGVFQSKRYWPRWPLGKIPAPLESIVSPPASILEACKPGTPAATWRGPVPDGPALSTIGTVGLLDHADLLRAAGIDDAKALDRPPGTLAALRAHRTRGTYGPPETPPSKP